MFFIRHLDEALNRLSGRLDVELLVAARLVNAALLLRLAYWLRRLPADKVVVFCETFHVLRRHRIFSPWLRCEDRRSRKIGEGVDARIHDTTATGDSAPLLSSPPS